MGRQRLNDTGRGKDPARCRITGPTAVLLTPLWLVAAVATSRAEAQPAATGAEAQAIHQRGVEAFAVGDLEAARSAFEAALAASPPAIHGV